MNAYFRGTILSGPPGPAGPDGNPVGTVISYMGLTAPEGYLVCDGAVHNIPDYPELAAFFGEQFGSVNHFGGDGVSTFAVPDLRNLFLRGFHGEAEEQMSGAIGERQEGTNYPMTLGSKSAIRYLSGTDDVDTLLAEIHPDSVIGDRRQATSSNTTSTSIALNDYYTGRPVNMAVLYCIKAAESVGNGLEEYDTEDGWHVRKWSSGYVEMSLTRLIPSFPFISWGGGINTALALSPSPFPVPLVMKFSETAGFAGGANGVGWLMPVLTNAVNPLTHSSKYEAVRPGNNPGPATICLSITGRWK